MLILGLVDLPWWAILLILCGIWYMYEVQHHNYFKDLGLPYMKPRFLIGSMSVYAKGFAKADVETIEKYKESGYVGEFFGKDPALLVWDEAILADVLVKESSSFINHWALFDEGSMMSKMLFNMQDERWKTVRNEMSPTFTTGKLKRMNTQIDNIAKDLGEILLEKAQNGEHVEAKELVGGFTLDVIASTAFGLQTNSLKDPNSVFVRNAKKIFELKMNDWRIFCMIYFPHIKKVLRKLGVSFNLVEASAEEFFGTLISQALEERRSQENQTSTDFLQLMINVQKGQDIQDDETNRVDLKGLTNDVIIANAVSFISAGFDPTANTLSLLMHCLALNPDVQQRLVNEIDKVVTDAESVDYSVLHELPYLEQCIHETMRMYGPALRTSRQAKEDTVIQGIPIKKGMVIQIPIYAMLRDPERWPEPSKFEPDRFSAENKGKRSPYHFIPFGYGPRLCIGQRLALQEIKMAAVHMLKRIRLEPCEKTNDPPEFENTALLRPKHIWLKVIPR